MSTELIILLVVLYLVIGYKIAQYSTIGDESVKEQIFIAVFWPIIVVGGCVLFLIAIIIHLAFNLMCCYYNHKYKE